MEVLGTHLQTRLFTYSTYGQAFMMGIWNGGMVQNIFANFLRSKIAP